MERCLQAATHLAIHCTFTAAGDLRARRSFPIPFHDPQIPITSLGDDEEEEEEEGERERVREASAAAR